MVLSNPTNFVIHCGDALEVLKTLPSESVNCCITSPPYYGLRDYGVDGQIGLDQTPGQYVDGSSMCLGKCAGCCVMTEPFGLTLVIVMPARGATTEARTADVGNSVKSRPEVRHT